MRSCEISRPRKADKELEQRHPELRAKRTKRVDEQVAAITALVQDAADQERPKPDPEAVLARIAILERNMNPKYPSQRVLLFLSDEPPFFRATTVAARFEREEPAERGPR